MSYLDKLFGLNNKITCITGAARGNGKAMALAIGQAGADLVLCDSLEKELLDTVKEIKNLTNIKVRSYCCDLINREEIVGFIKYIRTNVPRIDILVNNAGVTFSNNALNYSIEDWERTYKINLRAPFELSQEVGKIMKKNKGGVIINITSLSAEMAFPDNVAYITFKGALKQLSKALAYDLGKYNIRVNNIGPGYIKTNMTSSSWKNEKLKKERMKRTILGRWGVPNDLAGAVIFLSSDASSYITGQDLYVDGGWLVKGL